MPDHLNRHVVIQGKGAVPNAPKIYISDGTAHAYTGSCIFFLRLNPAKPISAANIAQELLFGSLLSEKEAMLGAIENLLSQTFIPAIEQQNFGSAVPGQVEDRNGNGNGTGDTIKQEFLGKSKKKM